MATLGFQPTSHPSDMDAAQMSLRAPGVARALKQWLLYKNFPGDNIWPTPGQERLATCTAVGCCSDCMSPSSVTHQTGSAASVVSTCFSPPPVSPAALILPTWRRQTSSAPAWPLIPSDISISIFTIYTSVPVNFPLYISPFLYSHHSGIITQ